MRIFTLSLLFLLSSPRAWPELSLQRVGLLLASRDDYDGQSLCVEGTAENILESVSLKKNPYYTLSVREGTERLRVFSFGKADITEGQSVLACGRFHKENKVGERTYFNEMTACLVESLPGVFGLALQAGRRPIFSGTVIGVFDGDTLEVLVQHRARPIRLEGVDCPEKRQADGRRAKQFTASQVQGKTVSVEVVDIDKYGRMVAWVKREDGRLLNEEIVRAGMGWWYKKYAPENKKLEQLETEARAAKRGLWLSKKPLPPWEFRHLPAKNRRRRKGLASSPAPVPLP
ncbi:MAG: thermonuclease family protein [Elusimicrobia bacterium]|nr:thermonuclease family protein [Elusimicrobiota bacterium]